MSKSGYTGYPKRPAGGGIFGFLDFLKNQNLDKYFMVPGGDDVSGGFSWLPGDIHQNTLKIHF